MTLAVIMQMRKRVGLLIGIIGVAIVAFLMMDALNSSSNLFNNNTQNVIGEVNGESVGYEAFNAKDKQVEKQFLYFQGNWQNPEFTGFSDEERIQMRNFAWNDFIVNTLLEEEYLNLGLTVTEQEINNQFSSNNPRGEVRNFYQQVVDGSGAYNPQQMANVLPQIESLTPQDVQRYPIKDFYLQLRALLQQELQRAKYQQLFAKSTYVPQWRAAQDYAMSNTTADLSIVGLQYSTLQESEIAPTDAELAAYLAENEAAYASPATRDIEYVIFNILPSREDSMEALNFVNEKWAQIEQNGRDSIYINQYSETRFSGAYFTQDEILTQVADSLFQVEPGTVIGPYLEDGKYRITKLYGREMLPDSVRVRHVFADYRQLSREDALGLIDSVQLMYNQGVAFDSLVIKYSTDQASAQVGGDLGYLSPSGNINRPIFNAIFRNNEVGTPFVVESPAGVHFMEITARTTNKEMVKYNTLDRSIRPGTNTRDSIYTLTSRFYTKYGTADSFDAGINKYNLVKRFGDNLTGSEVSLTGMGVPAREIFRWAFNEETMVDAVQLFKNYESVDNKYVVAKLTNATDGETPTVDAFREELRAAVILEQKGEQLKNQLSTAAAGAASLAQIAEKLGVEVKTSNGVSFKTQFIDGIGAEPIIAAVGNGLAVNAISTPVAGQYGVYLIQKTAETVAAPQENYSITQNQLRAALNNRFGQNLLDQLRTAADVTDQRYKFY